MSLKDLEDALAQEDAELEAQRLEQREKDLPFWIEARKKYGRAGVTAVTVPYTPGLPTMVIVHRPDPNYFTRYQSRLKDKTDEQGVTSVAIPAAEELADHCVFYPTEDDYKAVRKAFPGIHVQAGGAAAQLGAGQVQAAGKA